MVLQSKRLMLKHADIKTLLKSVGIQAYKQNCHAGNKDKTAQNCEGMTSKEASKQKRIRPKGI